MTGVVAAIVVAGGGELRAAAVSPSNIGTSPGSR